MKFVSRRSLLFVSSLFFAASALAQATAGRPHKAADRFERTKEHIDALLKQRLEPEPLPAKLANPFQVSSATPVINLSDSPSTPNQVPAPEPVEAVLSGDDEILAHYAVTLKVTGQLQIGGVAHLIINSAPYKEGSTIPVQGKGDMTYYLKVVRIAPTELTLGLNDATLVVPLKK